tara:strand:+ start:1485 stop:1751 length:267 start_codon:yes stop_codon:yes gene_type:complete
MSAPTDRVVFANLTTATTTTNYEGTTCISIINSGDNSISVLNSSDSYSGSVKLAKGEALTIEASTGFVNPIIRITTGSGTTDVSVMYS